ISRLPGRRPRRHRVRFASTSRPSTPLAVMRRVAAATIAGRAVGTGEANLRKKAHLPIHKRHGVQGKAPTPSLLTDETISCTTRLGSSLMPRARALTVPPRLPSPRPWSIASSAASTFAPRGWQATVFMAAVRLLKALVDRKITPHVPVWDKSARHDDTFSRADFVFDQERNVYICPGGKELTSTGNIDQGHIVYYRANKNDCSACLLKPRC